MGRLLGKTVFGAMDGRKIEAFRQSGYYDERWGHTMRKYYERQRAAFEADVDRAYAETTRKLFVLKKQEANRAYAQYFRSELPMTQASGMRWVMDLGKGRKNLARSPKSLRVREEAAKKLSMHFDERYKAFGDRENG